MKKNLTAALSFFILMVGSFLHADVMELDDMDVCYDPCMSMDGITFEFRASYYYPFSTPVRKIFHDGGVNYNLTGLFPLCGGCNPCEAEIDLWTGVDYFYKDGHSDGMGDKTRIQVIPVTLGLKSIFHISEGMFAMSLYTGLGMKYYFVHNHNSSDYVQKRVDMNGMGGIAEMGLLSTICDHFVLDIFVSYSYKKFGAPRVYNHAVKTSKLDLSGINAGGGIGYKF